MSMLRRPYDHHRDIPARRDPAPSADRSNWQPSHVRGMLNTLIFSYYPIQANGSRCPGEGIMTTAMVVEDDPAFLNRFCKIVASDIELELFAAVADVASARHAFHDSLSLTEGRSLPRR